MKKEELQQIQDKVYSEIKNLEKKILDLENKNTPIAQDCSIDNLNREDMTNEHKLNSELILKTKTRLNRLKTINFNDKNYGICQECDEEIAFQRLLLIPESKYCVKCLNELQNIK